MSSVDITVQTRCVITSSITQCDKSIHLKPKLAEWRMPFWRDHLLSLNSNLDGVMTEIWCSKFHFLLPASIKFTDVAHNLSLIWHALSYWCSIRRFLNWCIGAPLITSAIIIRPCNCKDGWSHLDEISCEYILYCWISPSCVILDIKGNLW